VTVQYLHTKLRVRDLDLAIAFYTAVFGYAVRARREGPEGSEIAFLVLPDGAAELQLAHWPQGGAYEVPARLLHLAFKVADLEAVRSSAEAQGATTRTGPYTLPSGSIVCFLLDPDGYDLELVQKPAG
jgi:lactoylglutathione lyase